MERVLRGKLRNGRFEGTSPERSRIMRAIKGHNNRTTEVRFRMALVRAGLRGWMVRPKGIIGNPDFWFGKRLVAVFVDGCFWHGCRTCRRQSKSNIEFWATKIKRNRNRDRATDHRLNDQGIQLVRIWEHELKNDLTACMSRLADALKGHRSRLAA